MMNRLLPVFVFMFSALGGASPLPVGQELNVDPRAAHKSYEYTYDSDWSWDLSIDSLPRLNNLQLKAQSFTWTLVQPSQNAYLVGWKPFDARYDDHLEISLSDRVEISEALRAGTDLDVVIADGTGKAVYFFNVGKFCAGNPHSVNDISNPAAPRCQPDVPEITLTACEGYRNALISYVSQGLMTCQIAETNYAKGSNAFGAHDCGVYKFCPGK